MPKIFFTSLVGVLILLTQIWLSWPDKYAHLVLCDVGQGDAILVTVGFNQLLIDGGRGTQVLTCLEEHLPFWDRQIELLILTHADEDHIGGLKAVLANYAVRQIISTKVDKDTQSFVELKKALGLELSQGAELKEPILGAQMSFSQEQSPPKWLPPSLESLLVPTRPIVSITFLSPQAELVTEPVENSAENENSLSAVENFFDQELSVEQNYNDLSIVTFLQLGQVEALLTGDLEREGELALLHSGLLHQTDILKVGHHGAKTSTSPEFAAAIRPETSLISVGKNNPYGHPSLEVIERLMQFEGVVWRTDEEGTIELMSDGVNYWVD